MPQTCRRCWLWSIVALVCGSVLHWPWSLGVLTATATGWMNIQHLRCVFAKIVSTLLSDSNALMLSECSLTGFYCRDHSPFWICGVPLGIIRLSAIVANTVTLSCLTSLTYFFSEIFFNFHSLRSFFESFGWFWNPEKLKYIHLVWVFKKVHDTTYQLVSQHFLKVNVCVCGGFLGATLAETETGDRITTSELICGCSRARASLGATGSELLGKTQ